MFSQFAIIFVRPLRTPQVKLTPLLHSQSSQISLKKQINFFSPCDYSLVNQKKGTKVQFMS